MNPHLDVELIYDKVFPGSIFLLCSDGLCNMIGKEQIVPVPLHDAPLALKGEMLVNMANNAGGRDNIPVTLVEILDEEAAILKAGLPSLLPRRRQRSASSHLLCRPSSILGTPYTCGPAPQRNNISPV